MNIRLLSLALVSLTLTNCGGGGGGGGSTSRTGIRVLHGAIDAAPIDLVVDSDGVVQTVRFGESVGYRTLSEGAHAVSTYRTKDLASALFSRSLTNSGDQKFTILLHGDRGQLGLRHALISESVPTTSSGAGLVRLIHGVSGAAVIEVNGTAGLEASFGGVSEYVNVPPGVASFRVVRKADGATLGRAEFVVESGQAYSIFLGGEADYLVNVSILDE